MPLPVKSPNPFEEKSRSLPFSIDEIAECAKTHSTPFHLYDERLMRQTCKDFQKAYSWSPAGFTNYFAVKATPNPHILGILRDEGLAADCSSLAELRLANAAGFSGEEIMFTSNNTPLHEFAEAIKLGAVINLDDLSHLDFLHEHIGLPELICFRYNPGAVCEGNGIIGKPEDAKFGLTRDQIMEAYRRAAALGAKRFGLHTMVVSNSLDVDEHTQTAKMMFELAIDIKAVLGISVEFINLGGGLGIPYLPGDKALDITRLGQNVREKFEESLTATSFSPLPKIFYESGRYITGPSGCLVTRVIHQKNIHKKHIGIDACSANLMRPAMYRSYHHITVVPNKIMQLPSSKLPSRKNIFDLDDDGLHTFDVGGSLCENNDKFAVDRPLKTPEIGDLLVIADTGAHGHCMGFNYNGKLRSAELLKTLSGKIVEIRRKETLADLFATLQWSGLDGQKLWQRLGVKLVLASTAAAVCGFVVGRVFAHKRN